MSALENVPAASTSDEPIPDDLAEAGFYSTMQGAFEHSLVVLALGEVCWLMPFGGGYRLLVEGTRVTRVRAELMSYDRECASWPPQAQPPESTMVRLDFVSPLLWALLVMAIYCSQSYNPEWTNAGLLDATAIFEHGQVWRALTALFIHADTDHLGSNLFGGVFLFASVLSVFGRTRGWLYLGCAAVVGNLAVAAAHYPAPYRAMGASTALFAGLGLLTGRAVRIAADACHPQRWRSLFVPSAAGLSVLALYGAGGPSVDVLAHITGFGSGLVLGFLAARVHERDVAK